MIRPWSRRRGDRGEERHLDASGALALVAECLAAVGSAALVAFALQPVVGSILLPRPSSVPVALSALVALATVLVGGAVIARPSWSRWRTILSWLLPAACSATIQALVFSGSRFYLNGTGDDQLFRMQLFGRMATTLSAADGNYADLPSFYPVGWFWLGGRFADLAGLEAWVAYKPFSIATMAVAPTLATVLWSRIVQRKQALLIGFAMVAVGLTVEAYEPYRWIVVVVVPPTLALALREFDRARIGSAAWWPSGDAVIVGLLLGFALAVYSLMFGLLLLGIVLAASLSVLRAEHTGRRSSDVARGVKRTAPALGVIGAVATAVGLPVWGPYLLAAVSRPSAGNGAARYFPEGSALFPFPMFDPGALGIVTLAGLSWILLGRTHRRVADACSVASVSCYLWHILSTAALARSTSLLAVIVDSALVVALTCAAVAGGWEVAGRLTEEHRELRRAALVVPLVGAMLFVSLTQVPSSLVADRLDATFAAFDDKGQQANRPPTSPREDRLGSWNGSLLSAIADTKGMRRPEDVVLLTDNWQLLVFRPFRGFQTIVQEYANPLALFPERREQIYQWSTARTPDELESMLTVSPFRPPDVFVLRRTPQGFAVSVTVNQFPLSQTNDFRDVFFDPAAFAGGPFERRDVGPYSVTFSAGRAGGSCCGAVGCVPRERRRRRRPVQRGPWARRVWRARCRLR